MPLVTIDDNPLLIDIPPANLQGISINRKAIPHTTQIEEWDKRVVMNVMICYYGNDGIAIDAPDKGIQPYVRRLVADNTTLVNIATGSPVCLVSEEYTTDEEGNTILNPLLENIGYVKEYQLFRQMMKSPQTIDDIMIAKIQYAADAGKFD